MLKNFTAFVLCISSLLPLSHAFACGPESASYGFLKHMATRFMHDYDDTQSRQLLTEYMNQQFASNGWQQDHDSITRIYSSMSVKADDIAPPMYASLNVAVRWKQKYFQHSDYPLTIQFLRQVYSYKTRQYSKPQRLVTQVIEMDPLLDLKNKNRTMANAAEFVTRPTGSRHIRFWIVLSSGKPETTPLITSSLDVITHCYQYAIYDSRDRLKKKRSKKPR